MTRINLIRGTKTYEMVQQIESLLRKNAEARTCLMNLHGIFTYELEAGKMDPKKARLASIMRTMIIPEQRKEDLGWLSRNIGIHNQKHPGLVEALSIITSLLKRNAE